MEDYPGADAPQDPAEEPAFKQRFKGVVRGLIVYGQARLHLLGIEGQEGTDWLIRRISRAAMAGLFLFIGYTLLIASGVAVLSLTLRIPWWLTCLVLAPLHLIIGWLYWRASKRPPKRPLFEESRKELAKDREWLANQNDQW